MDFVVIERRFISLNDRVIGGIRRLASKEGCVRYRGLAFFAVGKV